LTEKNSAESWKIPLYKIYSDDEDINLITKIIRRGSSWALGPEIEEFENAIKNYVGIDHCAVLNSGTSSLHATLLAFGLGAGDDILVPSFSFVSTANSVLFTNATPLFVDIEETTFGLNPKLISEKISASTKAIIPMDYGGQSCKIDEINKVARDEKLLLIEDAAESLGASINNNKAGSFGDAAIFSFCGNKVLTTGEGGAVVTNSKEIIEKIKLIRSHGRFDKINYFENTENSTYQDLGYNWRMSSITAALGISQLNKLDKIIKMRQKNAAFISSKLKKFPQIITPISPDGYEHIYQMYTIRLATNKMRDDLKNHLLAKRIFSKVYFEPIHLTPFYREKFNFKEGYLPVTEQISQQILTIPLFPNMTMEEKNYLVDSISEFFDDE
jgi:dTDP-4-amino-4,6-dideoxygalactose transaminase